MPYRRKNKWVGQVRRKGYRRQKLFRRKSEARAWEISCGKGLEEFIEDSDSLNLFKQKYQRLHESPHNTLADIFDFLMIDLDLPYKFRDVMQMARESNIRRNEKIPSTLRMKILERDNQTCQCCGAQAPDVKLQVDHIVPKSKGGLTEVRNLRVLCQDCNLGKRDVSVMVKQKSLQDEPSPRPKAEA